MALSQEPSWWRSALLRRNTSGMVEKVMVRLSCRCTVIRASGCGCTHWLALGDRVMRKDEGLRGRGETALVGQHPEVTPAVPVVRGQDRRDRCCILCPHNGGFVPLRVR